MIRSFGVFPPKKKKKKRYLPIRRVLMFDGFEFEYCDAFNFWSSGSLEFVVFVLWLSGCSDFFGFGSFISWRFGALAIAILYFIETKKKKKRYFSIRIVLTFEGFVKGFDD